MKPAPPKITKQKAKKSPPLQNDKPLEQRSQFTCFNIEIASGTLPPRSRRQTRPNPSAIPENEVDKRIEDYARRRI